MRGRRPHRAPRAPARVAEADRVRSTSTRSTPATRTSTASADRARRPDPRPGGDHGTPQAPHRHRRHHAGPLRRHDPGHHRAAGRLRRRTRRSPVRRRRVHRRRAGEEPRGRRAGHAPVRGRGPRRRARGDAHLRPGDAGGPAVGRRAAPAVPGQHPARTQRHPGVGHGRHDLQPGRARRAGHCQLDGARGGAVPRRHRRLAQRHVPGRHRPVGAGRRDRHRLAFAAGRDLRLRDERDGRHPGRRERALARPSAPRSSPSPPATSTAG